MADILLLRVRYAKRFTCVLTERGFEVTELLEKAGLDPIALENEDAWMPLAQLCRFLEVAVAETGYKTMGLDVGIRPRQQHSALSQRVLYSPTLYQSLQRLCENVVEEDLSANFRLTREGRDAWMRCKPVNADDEAIRQVELYRYAAIVEIIRCAAGSKWLPSVVSLQSEADFDIASADLLQGVEVQFGAPGLSIAVEPALLSRPMFDVPDVPTRTTRFENPPKELPDAFREVVRTQMLAQRNTIQDVAATLGLAPRTLQRRLAENEMSFSRLLENIRTETAKDLLLESAASIASIANDLGYKHSTHFSRAFRRECGVTPREFRKLRPERRTGPG